MGCKMIIAFCVPGRYQSMEWTRSWTDMLIYCIEHDINFYLYQWYTSDIYLCRNELITRELQIPWEMMPCFGGKPYDYMMWIDGDIGFKPDDVMKLVNSGKEIISGVCPMGPTPRCPAGRYAENEHGMVIPGFININSLDELEPDTIFEVDWSGFGFIAVKKGVFESMEYPWFRTTLRKKDRREINPSEDVGWCLRAVEQGYKIWLHSGVRVTHNKELCLRA